MEARPFERFIEDKPILTSEILMSRLYNVKLEHTTHVEKQVGCYVWEKVVNFFF